MQYYNLSTYLREKYGKRLKKICIDGGFSCPNRDGTCGTGGCIYCGERGAGEHIDPTLSIREQVERAISESDDGDRFIAYFQSFTNTYAPTDELKRRYDAALIDERIRILSIGTRPDCISESVCELLKEYAKEREVWVELGLQTASDEVAKAINRGYDLAVFEKATELLKKHGLKFVVHMIIGLPSDDAEGVKKTADYIAKIKPFGIKIHSIYVMEGTSLAKMYREKRYTPPTLDEYAALAAYTLSVMPDDVVVHRVTGDCPRDMLVAPEWNRDKNAIIQRINEKLSTVQR